MSGTDDPADLAIPDEPLPVSVLTGFLGSGKTTVLRRLLGHPAMDETAVVVNEFGEVGLDHLLVEKADEDTVLLNSGCLCCTVRGDLIDTLRRLFKRRVRREVPAFQRLVIETTGLADPAPILHTLMTDPMLVTRFRLDGVIATVDAVTGEATLDRHGEAVKQAAVADRLLVTKTDLAERAAVEALAARLAALNPAAPVHEVVQGAIEPVRLFNAGLYDPTTKSLDVRRWLKAEAYQDAGHGDGHDHDINRHDDRIRAFVVTAERPLDWDRLNGWIEMLVACYGADILRLKGILNVADMDRPLVVHGVQHLFHPPVPLERWPDGDRSSRLVFITRDLDRATFERTLREFTEDGPSTAVRLARHPSSRSRR
ncbi:MAG: GTP-binding protein [Rhodospirillales bacterium]|nr:GTP-binding protein [Rhodospirillales bacterium]MDH3790763.1 GTP-binding protein [Rhodospirillales bacterium]MDH3910441.1 GTP-binding protein [Rhodospirillales bacterium]MDH3919146.1 GTP-binding protein [Rhodospirillales bacterium]